LDLANARSSQERRNPKADKTRATKSGQINLLLTRARPNIDKLVQEFHIRRTTIDGRRETLKPYVTKSGYEIKNEIVRKDHYIDSYYGRAYTRNAQLYEGDEGSREVLPMSTQHVLSGEEHLEPKDNRFLYDLKIQDGGHGQGVIDLVLGILTGL
ncbi:MAG: hypothetical protein ORO03_08585, partial [Alphaproteobacteria bacterium]|nr:hypothetical protein [Alphaproteobacteria bacterium]